MGQGTDLTQKVISLEQGGRHSLDASVDQSIAIRLCIAEYQLFEGDVTPYSDLVSAYLNGDFLGSSSVQLVTQLIKLADNYASGELHRTMAEFSYAPVQSPDEAVVNQLYGQLVELVLHSGTKVHQPISEPISAYAAAVLTTNPVYNQKLLADAPRKKNGERTSCDEAIALLRNAYYLS